MAKANLESASRRSVVKGTTAAALAAIALPAVASEDSEILRLGRQFEPGYARFLETNALDHARTKRLHTLLYEATGYKWHVDAPEYGEPGHKEFMAEYVRISNAVQDDETDKVEEEERDELRDFLWPLAEKILNLEPKTIAELGVQARAMAYLYDEWWPPYVWEEQKAEKEERDHWPRHFVETVLRLAGQPNAGQTA